MAGRFKETKLNKVEITDFKSFKGSTVVGPFADFTCLVGPNGNGKSNITDAMGWALEVDPIHLRARDQRQLFYKDAKEARKECSVALYFSVGDTRVVLKKTLTQDPKPPHKLVMKYTANSKTMTKEKYRKLLHDMGLRGEQRNFMVLQDDVAKASRLEGKSMVNMIEDIAGGGKMRAEVSRLGKQLKASNDKTGEAMQRRKIQGMEQDAAKMNDQQKKRLKEMTTRLRDLKKKRAFTHLSYHERSIARISKNIEQMEDEGEANEGKRLKKEFDQCQKAYGQAQEGLRTARAETTRLVEQQRKLRKLVSDLKPKIDDAEKAYRQANVSVNRFDQETGEADRKIGGVEGELQKVKRALDEENGKKLEPLLKDRLAPADFKAFEDVRAQAREKSKGARSSILVQETEVERNRIAISTAHSSMEGLRDQFERTENELKKVQMTLAAKTAEEKEAGKALKDLDRAIGDARKEEAERKEKSQELKERIEEAQNSLDEHEGNSHDSHLFNQKKDLVKKLQRNLGADRVHGVVLDLVQIPGNYEIATFVAMGGKRDWIVVDTTGTAKECMQILKSMHVSSHFLPLDNLKPTRCEFQDRTISEGCKPLMDVLTYDDQFEPALAYVIEDTLVCATLGEARAVGFGEKDGKRHKVVTTDGSLVKKMGSIVGGKKSISAKAKGVFGVNKVGEFRKMKDEAEQELLQLERSGREGRADQLADERSGKQHRHASAIVNLEAAQRSIETLTNKSKAIKASLRKEEDNLDKREKEQAREKKKLEEFQKKVHEDEAGSFKQISQKTSIPNINQYASRTESEHRIQDERTREFGEQAEKLERKLANYQADKERLVPLADRKKEKQAAQKRKEKLEKELKGQKAALEETTFGKAEEEVRKAAGKEKNAKAALLKSKAEIDQRTQRANEREIRKGKMLREIKAYRERRSEWLSKARTEGVELSWADGNGKEIKGSRKRGRSEAAESSPRKRRRGARNADKLEFGEVLEADNSDAADKDHFGNCLYFGDFNDTVTINTDHNLREFQTTITKEMGGLGRMITTLHQQVAGSDAAKKAGDDEEEDSAEFDEKVRQENKELVKKIAELNEKRLSAYNTTFDQVAEQVQKTYKELTATPENPTGGIATLRMDRPSRPFDGSAMLNVVPPTKGRHQGQVKNLSGGEKTIAGLAFLLALHTIHPSPFFILDEIDAPLDETNMSLVTEYITQNKHKTQFIVVSLKAAFAQFSTVLLGVSKTNGAYHSSLFVLNVKGDHITRAGQKLVDGVDATTDSTPEDEEDEDQMIQ